MTTAAAAERRLRWLVAALADPGDLTPDDLVDVYDTTGWRGDWSFESEIEFFRNGRHSGSRPLSIDNVFSAGPNECTAVLAGADGKRWSVTCWVEETKPHRITRGRLVPTPPEGLEIRLANPEDGPALAALERRAPIRLGEDPITLMTLDHGEDYFAPSRLMEEVTIYVAELNGRIAGAYCAAVQPVQVDGEAKRLFLEHHVRIDPETSRGAVFWALCDFGRDRYARATDSIAFYVALDNLAVRKFVSGVPPWSVPPLRALIPCHATSAGTEELTAASPGDAARLLEILNGCHSRSALFVPYSEQTLAGRLSRDPDQYSWGNLSIHGGAVVGVGRDLVRVTKTTRDAEQTSIRAVALDHGFLPGNEEDYETLLRWRASRLASTGATHLAVYTSQRSPTYEVIAELAEEIERFDFWAFDLPEPASLADHGFYVDPVYF